MSVSLQDLQILSVIIRVRDDNPTPENRRKLFSADHYLIESRGISDDMGNPTGFLASSPWVFYGMGNVAPVSSDRLDEMLRVHGLDADFVMTNRGIRIRLPIQHLQDCAKTYIAFMACGQLRPPTLFAIYLRQVSGNRFTRMRPSHVYTPLQPDLLEIPLSAIVRSKEIWAENLLVDVSQKQAQPQRRKPYAVWLDVAPLCHILQQRGFIILDGSWNRESRKWYILTGQDVFLIVSNGFEELELMLVISLEDEIGIRVITLGTHGAVPGCTRNQPPRKIYRAWRRIAEPDDCPTSTRFIAATMADGQEFTFVLINPADDYFNSTQGWRLLALPRMGQDSVIIHSPAHAQESVPVQPRLLLDAASPFPPRTQTLAPVSTESDGYSPVYLGSAVYPRDMHPCKISPSCRPYGGEGHRRAIRFELLPFDDTLMEWVPASRGKIPESWPRPIEGGYEEHGAKLYHALAEFNGNYVPGKTGRHLVSLWTPIIVLFSTICGLIVRFAAWMLRRVRWRRAFCPD